ncbi:hypothetical protein Bca4012_092817 [Brassica carinata]
MVWSKACDAGKENQGEGSSLGPRAKKWSKDDAYYLTNMKNVIPVTQIGCPIAMEALGVKVDVETLFEHRVFASTGVYEVRYAKESFDRSPVLRYPVRIIGSMLYGTMKAVGVMTDELCLLFQGMRYFFTQGYILLFPTCTQFQHGSGASREFDRIQSFLDGSKSKTSAVMVKGKHGDNVLQFVGISLLMNEELFCGPNSKFLPSRELIRPPPRPKKGATSDQVLGGDDQ